MAAIGAGPEVGASAPRREDGTPRPTLCTTCTVGDGRRAYSGRRPEVVYPARVSDKPPQTYILHTFVLFIVIVVVMVLFLKHQWG